MLRRILGATAVLGVLSVAPITIDRADTGPLPTVALNDASCATDEEAKCCIEIKSICMDGDEAVMNHRGAAGNPCRR
ncbi:MAG: hypothetical protein OER90_19390 [Gemmatimonadota bacterium]|nr:hypothetical protein [Gemmatimonadota bacterium]